MLALSLVAASCSDAADGTPKASTPPAVSGTVTSIVIDPAPDSVLAALASVELRAPRRIRGVARSDRGHEITIPTTREAADSWEIPVVGMRAEQVYSVSLEAVRDDGSVDGGAEGFIESGPLPEGFPDLDVVEVDAERMADGITMFDVGQWATESRTGRGSGLLLAVDDEGEVIWYYESLFTVGDARLTDQGTVLMNMPPFSINEVDITGRELRRWEPKPPAAPGAHIKFKGTTVKYASLHHEANPLANGNILALATTLRRSTPADHRELCPQDDPEDRFQEDVVFEFRPDGRVVKEWLVSDIVPRQSVRSSRPCGDWAHTNGVVLDPDRNAVIVTARAIDLLFAFRYEADADGPSGELLWSIGPDGTLPLDGHPSYGLHAPEVEDDGSVLVYDNGNGRPSDTPFSRAVRYRIDDGSPDPDDWTATQVWAHRAENRDGTPLYADFLSDADLLDNGNVLVDHGGIGQSDPPASGRIVEVLPGQGGDAGEIVFDVWLPDTWVSYRAERIKSLYAGPMWEPIIPG